MERNRNNEYFVDCTYCLFLFNYVWLLLYFIAFIDSPFYVPMLGIVYGAHIIHWDLEFSAKYRFAYQKGFEAFFHTPGWMKFFAWMMWCPILFVDSDKWRQTIIRQKWLFGKNPVKVIFKISSLAIFGVVTATLAESVFQWTVYAVFLFHLIILTMYEIDFVNTIWISLAFILVIIIVILIGGFIIWLWTSWGCKSRRYVEVNGRYVEEERKSFSFI
jgi:hypothetical protein